MPPAQKEANYNGPCVVLGMQREWWIFLLSSILLPFILAFFVLSFRFLRYFAYRKKMAQMAKTNLVLNREQRYGPKVSSLRIGEVWRWFQNMQTGEETQTVLMVRFVADHLVSPRFRTGKIMLLIDFVLSMGSLIIYFSDVSTSKIVDVEICRPFTRNVNQMVDFAFNCFFLVHYILRFLASEEKIVMIFNLYSIIDYFTVPPSFVGLIRQRRWIGLKFLRVIYLRKVSTVLASMGIMRSPPHIKLLQLGLTWIAILLAAGGVFHLLDTSGDFYYAIWNGQRVSYWEYSYFAFTTMATIGGSETNPHTDLAKIANCCLVFIVLAVICFAIPDVKEMVGSRRKWGGEHRAVHNERHIVVCGDVSFDSVYSLFLELFHPDRDVHDIKIVCLDEQEPDLEFTRFLKRNTWRIGYLQGSVLQLEDLRRAKLHEADACMILANKTAADIDAEDSSNIMCVVAVKNYNPRVRVIMQLLQYRSKTYLTSIPNWDPTVGDDVICLPEIKLGLIAQSCIAPGFSTLMANMFAARSGESGSNCPEYMENYLAGAGMEMYTEKLSNSFLGLPFIKAVEICFERLHILLFAVSVGSTNGDRFSQVIVNPDPSYIIKTGASGCFVADSAQQVQHVLYYCSLCHADVDDPDTIKPCQCEHLLKQEEDASEVIKRLTSESDNRPHSTLTKRKGATRLVPNGLTRHIGAEKAYEDNSMISETTLNHSPTILYVDDEDEPLVEDDIVEEGGVARPIEFSSFEEKIVYYMRHFGSLESWQAARNVPAEDDEGDNTAKSGMMDYREGPRYDSTGMFWWCPPRAFVAEIMNRFEAAEINFHDHVVLLVFADENSTLIGLNNLIMPLRCSNVPFDELPHIVIVGDPKYLAHEWPAIINFPKISVVKVMHLSRADLRAVNIDQCRQCVLLSAGSSVHQDDVLLIDIDPVLTTLTIKAMHFGDNSGSTSVAQVLLEDAPIGARSRTSSNAPLTNRNFPPVSTNHLPFEQAMRNRKLGGTTREHLFNAVPRGSLSTVYDKSSFALAEKTISAEWGWAIPIITELVHDSNVQFVDQEDEDISDFFMAEPFVCGQAFTTSVLQALLVSTYFNPYTLSIMRSLIFGGVTPELEQILAEGTGLIGGPNLSHTIPHPDRCRVDQVSLEDYRFARHANGTYGDLFFDALRNYSMICMGLYRKVMPEATGPRSARRYVITNPPVDFALVRDDKVFVIARLRWD